MPREHARGGFLVTSDEFGTKMEFSHPQTGNEPEEKWELISSHVVVVIPEEPVVKELVCVWQKVFYAV